MGISPPETLWTEIQDTGLMFVVNGNASLTIKGPCGACHTLSLQNLHSLVKWARGLINADTTAEIARLTAQIEKLEASKT